MATLSVDVDLSNVSTWPELHTTFQEAMGFPDFYGRNSDAWIDCMSCVDEAALGMSKVTVPSGDMLEIRIAGGHALKEKDAAIYAGLLEMVGFVNWRRREVGDTAVLRLAIDGKAIDVDGPPLRPFIRRHHTPANRRRPR